MESSGNESTREQKEETADLLLHGATVVTMDAERRSFCEGAIAVRDGLIVDVGRSSDLLARWLSRRKLNLKGLVATPGLINSHIHLTGDGLFPGIEPDDSPRANHMSQWILPPYEHSQPEDERAASRFVVLQMLKQGTTAFVEAGTCRYPAAVLEGLGDLRVRGAIGIWASDRWPQPGVFDTTTEQAIERIQAALSLQSERIDVWPDVLGTAICSDELYQAAAQLAREFNRHWTFHMSPEPNDGAAYRERTGRDPLVHLGSIGALDDRCVIAHAIHISDTEVNALNRSGATVVFSPGSALHLSSGVTKVGRHPDLDNVALGTDALNASNHLDLLRSADLACAVYADARKDRSVLTAERSLEWLIHGGARALGRNDIGSLQVGKRADISIFDVTAAPIYNVANSLVYGSARAVHVFIDGEQVLDNGHVKDEESIISEAAAAAQRVAQRANFPSSTGWPLLN
jgi:cytosine/adenosine deaminase-related metal-dependent hydrolase